MYAKSLLTRKMPVVYTAGPYRSKTLWEVSCKIRNAEVLAHELWCLGFSVICPHKNTGMMDSTGMDDELILQGDFNQIARCDAVVVIPGWEKSEGTKMEIEVAHAHCVPCFYWEEVEDRALLEKWINGDERVPAERVAKQNRKGLPQLVLDAAAAREKARIMASFI